MFDQIAVFPPGDDKRPIFRFNGDRSISLILQEIDEGEENVGWEIVRSYTYPLFATKVHSYIALRRLFVDTKELLNKAKELIDKQKANEQKKIVLETKKEMLQKELSEIETKLKEKYEINSSKELEVRLKKLMAEIKIAIGLDGE